jgi:hypothetical protein
VNVLYADGHVATRSNSGGEYSVDVSDSSQLRSSFDKILEVFERADVL